MLKRFIFAVGALLAATLMANGPAAASVHRAYRGHYSHAALAYHPVRGRTVARGQFSARTRLAYSTRTRFGQGYGRFRTARGYGVPQQARVSLIRHGYRYRFARHSVRFAAARRDNVIRNYVGSQAAYAPVSTPVTGGTQVGNASYYSGRNHTASGGFVGAATCAHRTLPFGTRVLVTNLANSRQAVLTVNDRGPFIRGRIVDVSTGAAGVLGMLHSGTAPVRVQVVGGPG